MPFQAGKRKEGEPYWVSCCVTMRLRWGRGGYQAVVQHGTWQGEWGMDVCSSLAPAGTPLMRRFNHLTFVLTQVGAGHPSGQGQLGRRLDHPDSGKMSPLCRGQLRINDHM